MVPISKSLLPTPVRGDWQGIGIWGYTPGNASSQSPFPNHWPANSSLPHLRPFISVGNADSLHPLPVPKQRIYEGAFVTPENLENTGGGSSKAYLHVSVVLQFLGDLAEVTEELDISHASRHITKLLTMSNFSVSLWLKLTHLFPLNCQCALSLFPCGAVYRFLRGAI